MAEPALLRVTFISVCICVLAPAPAARAGIAVSAWNLEALGVAASNAHTMQNTATRPQAATTGPPIPGPSDELTYAFALSHPFADGSSATAHGPLELTIQTVPEPATLALAAAGLIFLRRRPVPAR